MIESGKDCEDVLTQIMAAKSALNQVGLHIIGHSMKRCLIDDEEKSRDELIDEAIGLPQVLLLREVELLYAVASSTMPMTRLDALRKFVEPVLGIDRAEDRRANAATTTLPSSS
jgi:hypothetical protein